MARRDAGPRRSDSVESYLRETRAAAAVAVLALGAGIVSDVLARGFWSGHALLAGLASSVIVVMLSIALVNELVERRKRQRWSVLAQYVMLQLVSNARLTWTGMLDLAGLLPPDHYDAAALQAGAQAVADPPRMTRAIREVLADRTRRGLLHESIAHAVAASDELLGRWAGVMLTADVYAEIIDRNVELVGDLAWLATMFDHFESPDERVRARSWSHPAVQIEGKLDDDKLTARLVAITQLAVELDHTTLDLALRLVPIEWWATRLGTTSATGGGQRTLSRRGSDAGAPVDTKVWRPLERLRDCSLVAGGSHLARRTKTSVPMLVKASDAPASAPVRPGDRVRAAAIPRTEGGCARARVLPGCLSSARATRVGDRWPLASVSNS
jgi:hypothetical protein